jgi:hypothetical protein
MRENYTALKKLILKVVRQKEINSFYEKVKKSSKFKKRCTNKILISIDEG